MSETLPTTSPNGQLALDPVVLQDTFRLPSTALFLGLMPVFSGLARRADLAAVLEEDDDDAKGARRPKEPRTHTYIIHSARQSEARTSLSLFDDDPLWSEGELSTLIRRQFGPTGLKHLMSVLIAADEQAVAPGAQPGAFVFDASHHLDLLGYKRSNRVNGKGYHTARHLREAREIVTLLCALTIVQEVRLGAHRGATLKIRLLLDEASAEAWEETVADGAQIKQRIVTNEKIFLRFNPHLFMAAAKTAGRARYEYTLQLRKLARENARTHGLVLTLGVHLPIKFRRNGCQPLRYSARAFLRMAGIAEDEYTRYEHLDRLEKALRYMVEQGYLASFETGRYRYFAPAPLVAASGEEALRESRIRPPVRRQRAQMEFKAGAAAEPLEPMEEMWEVQPPGFLSELLQTADRAAFAAHSQLELLARTSRPRGPRAAQPVLPGVEVGGRPPSAGEKLKALRANMGLNQAELAARLDCTQAAVSMAEKGVRPRMAERLLELARRLA
jgi:DNA-binding XRE family transcriptional regulator